MSGTRWISVSGANLLSGYNVKINGDNVFNGAEPSVEPIKVPGRNGDIIFSDNRFNNVQIKYPCMMTKDFMTNFPRLRAFLYQDPEYRVIRDSYFPGMYRMGRIVGTSNPTKISWTEDAALFTITFDCKPQHFYDATAINVASNSTVTVTNPSVFPSRPLIELTIPSTDPGSSNNIKLSISNDGVTYYSILIDKSIYFDYGGLTEITIDFELLDAYATHGNANLNKYIIEENTGDFEKMKFSSATNYVSTLNASAVIRNTRFWTL